MRGKYGRRGRIQTCLCHPSLEEPNPQLRIASSVSSGFGSLPSSSPVFVISDDVVPDTLTSLHQAHQEVQVEARSRASVSVSVSVSSKKKIPARGCLASHVSAVPDVEFLKVEQHHFIGLEIEIGKVGVCGCG